MPAAKAARAKPLVRVAIVGGGCAGLAAAWELSRPAAATAKDGAPRCEITVYERSTRLGGKGASGRDAHGRIREHGLHIWLGFYENAFRLMRECYAEAERAGFGPQAKTSTDVLAHRSFDDAFFPEPHVGVATDRGAAAGAWEAWTGHLPPMPGEPGTPLDRATNPFTLLGYLRRCLALTKALMLSMIGPAGGATGDGRPLAGERSTHDRAIELDFAYDPTQSPNVLVETMARWLRLGALGTATGLLNGASLIETWLREHDPAPQWNSTFLAFLEALATQARRQLSAFVEVDPVLRRKTEVIDLIFTIVVGLYRDRVLFDSRGLDAIDHIDCKAWLLQHGALKSSVDSPFVTALYDLAFCYEGGDRSRPGLAAGQALRGALRMFFTYRGALFWRMRSGMGDAVFAPLYRVLKHRGVRFEFLHALTEVDFALDPADDRRVTRLHFDTPHQLAGEPLDAGGCWPYDAAQKARRRKTQELLDGRDFDAVVMAMGIDDFRALCPKALFDAMPAWQRMCQHVKTIGTQAAQVWLGDDLDALGWRRGPVLVSGSPAPLETWADMTHTLAAERAWRRQVLPKAKRDRVGSIHYFCGTLPDAEINAGGKRETADARAARLKRSVEANLSALLGGGIAPLWPSAEPAGDPRRPLASMLAADGQPTRPGSDAIAEQHVQANAFGSDRYTLALPGTIEHRISPLDESFANMTIAGDWTSCGFNEGCVEAAVMSGMLAAHAIAGRPALERIVGYHHP